MPNAWQTNTLHFWLSNNLDSGAFRGAQAQWDKITVPMFTVGNWTGMALHLRGNTEAFMRAASKHKKLRIHTGTHVHPFYTEEGRRDQLRFFDYWLKGIDNGVMDEPPVKLAIRKGRDEIEWRHEHEWPLARTQWTRLYFDLSPPAPGMAGECRRARLDQSGRRCSSRTYPATSLGSMGSTSAASSQVMGGGIKPGMGDRARDAAAAAGRRGHRPARGRALGVERDRGHGSVPHAAQLRRRRQRGAGDRPAGHAGAGGERLAAGLASRARSGAVAAVPAVSQAQRRLYLTPGEIVQVEVEIWPTSMVFRKGHRIRLDVQPRDGVGSQSYMHYHADYNTGTNTIYAGGDRESYLLLPVIPAVDPSPDASG